MFLVVYNLAFIAPLIVIFILAAKGADSERMSRWSKRNVFPSKIAMGAIFALLGVLVFLRLGGFVVAPGRCPVEWKNVIIFENLQGKARFEA